MNTTNQETPEQIAERISPCLAGIKRKITSAIQAERDAFAIVTQTLLKTQNDFLAERHLVAEITADRNSIIAFHEARADKAERALLAVDKTEAELAYTQLINHIEDKFSSLSRCAHSAPELIDCAAAELAEAEKIIEPFGLQINPAHSDLEPFRHYFSVSAIRSAAQWLERRRP